MSLTKKPLWILALCLLCIALFHFITPTWAAKPQVQVQNTKDIPVACQSCHQQLPADELYSSYHCNQSSFDACTGVEALPEKDENLGLKYLVDDMKVHGAAVLKAEGRW